MVTIRMPKSQIEYREACALVESVYREHHYVQYLAMHPSNILIAVDEEGHVVGSVGLLLANGEPLPTESYFGFSSFDLDPCYGRHEIFEICRLASYGKHRDAILRGLVVAICEFTERMAYERAIACMKPPLLVALQRRLGVVVHPIEREVVDAEIEEIYRGYFLSEPRPVPVYLDRSDLAQYLPELRDTLVGKVEVVLDGYGNLGAQLELAALPSITP